MRKLLVVLGVPIDNLTMEEALERCDAFIADARLSGRTHQIATVNADFVVNSLNDPELRRILQEASMATADGMPLVWASRLLGGPIPGRVTGADLVPALAERAAQKGYSLFFLGARPGVAAVGTRGGLVDVPLGLEPVGRHRTDQVVAAQQSLPEPVEIVDAAGEPAPHAYDRHRPLVHKPPSWSSATPMASQRNVVE